MLRLVEEDDEITLFSTASRCLELLIEKHGSTLSQKELMDAAWVGQGYNVTPNTFYQNISNVRKALNALLPEKPIIFTIKRVGLFIPDDISIIPILDEATEPSSACMENSSTSAIDEEITNHSITTDPVSIKPIDQPYSLFNLIAIGIFFLSIALLAGSLYFQYEKGQERPMSPFRNYVIYKRFNNGCTILINPDAGRIDSANRYLNSSSDCKGYKEVYVTLWEQKVTTSAMFCSPINDGKGFSCVSEYFARSQK